MAVDGISTMMPRSISFLTGTPSASSSARACSRSRRAASTSPTDDTIGIKTRTGPFIAVANHNGGPMLPDCWVMAAFWWASLGPERPAYAMVHDAALAVPGLRSFLVKVGGLRGTRANAERVLRLGADPGAIACVLEPDALLTCWLYPVKELNIVTSEAIATTIIRMKNIEPTTDETPGLLLDSSRILCRLCIVYHAVS